MIEPEKKDAGSPFRLADRRALPAAEWVWREKRRFPKCNQELFAAQFVLGEDPSERADVAEDVSQLGAAAAGESAAHEVAPRDHRPRQRVPSRPALLVCAASELGFSHSYSAHPILNPDLPSFDLKVLQECPSCENPGL